MTRREGRKVECEVGEADVMYEGHYVPGVCVTCGRCGHEVEVGGQSGASIRRGLVTLREECPEGERNFYVGEGDDDE